MVGFPKSSHKLYVHTCNEHAWREDTSLTFVIQLSMWVIYYRDPITFCTSIIESFKGNQSQLIFSVTEKFKIFFSVTYKHQGGNPIKKSQLLDEIMNF